MREVPDSFAGGLRRPLQAIGLSAAVPVVRIIDGLRADADWLRRAATHEQQAAVEGRDPRSDPGGQWANTEEGRRADRADKQRQLRDYVQVWGRPPA